MFKTKRMLEIERILSITNRYLKYLTFIQTEYLFETKDVT